MHCILKLISYSELYKKRRCFIVVALKVCFNMPMHILRVAADTEIERFTSALVYTVDVITWYVGRKRKKPLMGSKKCDLELSAEKIVYVFMSRQQNSGQNHNIKLANK
jgi:hypothetical protein